MSFLSVLKTIGKDVVIGAQVASPFLNLFLPGVGSVVNIVAQGVVKAEQVYQEDAQAGVQKKQMVLDEFAAMLPLFNQALAAHGLKMSVSMDTISQLIDSTVAQFNAAAALSKQLITIEKV